RRRRRGARDQHPAAEPRESVHRAHRPRPARVGDPVGAFHHLLQADVRRLFKTPSVPILWLAFPLALSLIEYSAFGGLCHGATGMPKGDLLLVDRDRTLLTSFFEQALHRQPMSDFFSVVHVDSSRSVEKDLSHDEGSAALILPKGFQDSVLAGGHITLTYVPNAMEEIKPKMIESTLRTFLEIANRFLHEGQDAMKLLRVQTKRDRAPTRLEVLAMSGAFYDVGQRFTKLSALGDLAVKLQRPPPNPCSAVTSGNSVHFFAYFLPGLLLFSLLMVARGFERRAFVLRERGLVRRIAASPVSPAVVVSAHVGVVLAAAITTGVIVLG